ncbi:6-bladed beta-propeller [Sunxiuqinia elliptica]|nr:6-bladed beta-propeller [Sunxiuqinia elliptica]
MAEGNGKQILFKYNKAGKNPIQIGAIGKGASEYLTCSYFAVLEAKDRVYINGKPNTVLVYNTNGEFIRSFRFKNSSLRFNQMEIFDNGHLFLAQKGVGSNIEHLWSISDTLGNIVSQKKNTLPTFQTNIGSKGGVFQSGEGFSYWIDHNDTIFSISPNFSFRPSYVFTLGEHRWSNKNVNVYSLKEHIEKRKKFYTPHFFIETQKYLISQYAFKEKNSYVFLNKETHKTLTCDFNWKTTIREGIPNNFDNGIMFNVESYFNQGQSEFLIGVIFPYQLKAHVASDAFKNSTPLYPEKKKELERLANSLDQNDNPVLMLLELKQ